MPKVSEKEQSAVRPGTCEKFTQKFMEARLVTSEKTIKILNVAKTLAKIGDSIISSSNFDFKTESSLFRHYYCRRCELGNNCPQTARVKVLARQLACIGDELMTAN